MTRNAVGKWKAVDYDDRNWDELQAGGPPPYMSYFQFRPNAFILSQYRKQMLCPTNEWRGGETIYFRKVIEVQ
jgi:hypothetical protein